MAVWVICADCTPVLHCMLVGHSGWICADCVPCLYCVRSVPVIPMLVKCGRAMRVPLLVQEATVGMRQQDPSQRTWDKLACAEYVLAKALVIFRPVLSWSGPCVVVIGPGHAAWWHAYPAVAYVVCSSAHVCCYEVVQHCGSYMGGSAFCTATSAHNTQLEVVLSPSKCFGESTRRLPPVCLLHPLCVYAGHSWVMCCARLVAA
jgi:hypothetical protein